MIERSDISILLQAILFASIFYALKDQIPPKNSLLKSLAVYRKHFGIFQPKLYLLENSDKSKNKIKE